MTREEINKDKQKEIENEHTKSIIKKIIIIFLKVTLSIFIIIILFFSYNTYISTSKIIVKEKRLIDKKIPNSFNGIKIIQFSDLHYGSTINIEKLKEIRKIINKRKPDIIIFTGDLIDTKYSITENEKEKLINELEKIDTTLGKYAILGDEDDNSNLFSLYNQAGFITLNNQYELIYHKDNNPILLIGLGSLINDDQDLDNSFNYFKDENSNKNIYTIVAVHEPDSIIDIKSLYNPDLVLAGHSHNGNIIIPFINTPLIKNTGAKKYNKEFYNIDNTKVYISSGLGTNNGFGIRLFCRPSINFFRLSNS